MLYAKVAVGLPIECAFDYFVPEDFLKKIKEGARVWVNFRNKKKLGYVIKTTSQTNIKNVLPILDVIDDTPVLDKNMLLLTKKLSDYYCCSWGEAIETALPEDLRKGKIIPDLTDFKHFIKDKDYEQEISLIHDLEGNARWDVYISRIEEAISLNKSVIVLFPEISLVIKAKEIIKARLQLDAQVLYRKQHGELQAWTKIKKGEANIIVGSRSCIFAPAKNLGLIIIDEEQSPFYKQEQVPHYHARLVALMRSDLEKVKLILTSSAPSLESLNLARQNKIKYIVLPRRSNVAQVDIIDMKNLPLLDKKHRIIISKYLQDSILATLSAGRKTLLFLNRKGFATFASCSTCGKILKCPRCNINLVYHFYKPILSCHYCNFKMSPPKICPDCNSGYIKYSGAGTEKIESELSRIFPQARIKRCEDEEKRNCLDGDIFISTQVIIKQIDYKFDLIGILSIDNSLNYVDLRSSEKTFGLLTGLMFLTKNKMVIQTSLPNHYVFKAFQEHNENIFYDEELRQRKQLRFPPYSHFVLISCRGKNEEKVEGFSKRLFKKLSKSKAPKGLKIVSLNPAHPPKLRGNFYWIILIRTNNIKILNRFLKINSKGLKHSGIIVTVDVDPL
jgi:primosomal protein N' (replication factor Y)